jgi:archaeal flagellar protein FlaI
MVKKGAKKRGETKKSAAPKTEKIDFSSSIGSEDGQQTVSVIDSYSVKCRDIPLEIKIYNSTKEYVPIYEVFVPAIGAHTRVILEKMRQELVKSVHLGVADISDMKGQQKKLQETFKESIQKLVDKYFPSSQAEDKAFFVSYMLLRSIGLGEVEILMSDDGLEEVAINSASQPIWVFHRKYGWLKTNIQLKDEDQIRYFATTIGRKAGRQISVLEPLMDVTLAVGDRVNATLSPISNEGNTITIRKFASKPWTITDFIKHGTITHEAAAILWQAIQFELSILIAGGTASGKTSMLNILSNFFPPNQRIISIEDTREIKLPKFLHWIPMLTRLPNTEGRGGVTMLRLLQNSLRQRPDRIIVGEIRRPEEAEVLFEAIHTGHSVYATVHANTADETVARLTNPPISIPKMMISALSLVVVQYRNRRSGLRRTFQIAEILENGDANVLMQYDASKDKLTNRNMSKIFLKTIETFSGISKKDLMLHLKEKEKVLQWMVKNNINTVEGVGEVMAQYYTDSKALLKKIK